jgi:hypothetical protein
MLAAARKRVTYANVVMTLALVFAMTGGAFAAKHYLITSTKQISPKVLKALKGARGPAGATGAQGPAGSQGPAGANGKDGTNGSNGSNGAAGESVKVAAAGSSECAGLGGARFSNGTGAATACNGRTGFTKTLPSGATETGDWGVADNTTAFKEILSGVSFNIPLEKAPTPVYVKANATSSEHCPGTVAEPAAAPGYLCVYAHEEQGWYVSSQEKIVTPTICALGAEPAFECVTVTSETGSADPTGFGIVGLSSEEGTIFAYGTWAVTAS